MKWEYWKWFFRGVDGQSPGLFSLFDRWVLVHLVIAAVLSACIDVSVKDAASTVLLPLASIYWFVICVGGQCASPDADRRNQRAFTACPWGIADIRLQIPDSNSCDIGHIVCMGACRIRTLRKSKKHL